MELLFVVLGGVFLGAIARYTIPQRHTYGAFLLPALGGIVAAVVWAALTWLGWRFDGGWIWVVSLVLAGLVSAAAAIVIPRRRRVADDRMLARLSSPTQVSSPTR